MIFKNINIQHVLIAFLVGYICACNTKKKTKEIIVFEEEPPDALISYDHIWEKEAIGIQFFYDPIGSFKPYPNVFPYDLNTPLFTDYALKKRFIFIPEGLKYTITKEMSLSFPLAQYKLRIFTMMIPSYQMEMQKL